MGIATEQAEAAPCTAFAGDRHIASGPLRDVALAAKAAIDRDDSAPKSSNGPASQEIRYGLTFVVGGGLRSCRDTIPPSS